MQRVINITLCSPNLSISVSLVFSVSLYLPALSTQGLRLEILLCLLGNIVRPCSFSDQWAVGGGVVQIREEGNEENLDGEGGRRERLINVS